MKCSRSSYQSSASIFVFISCGVGDSHPCLVNRQASQTSFTGRNQALDSRCLVYAVVMQLSIRAALRWRHSPVSRPNCTWWFQYRCTWAQIMRELQKHSRRRLSRTGRPLYNGARKYHRDTSLESLCRQYLMRHLLIVTVVRVTSRYSPVYTEYKAVLNCVDQS